MSNIPEGRKRLLELADLLRNDELDKWSAADELQVIINQCLVRETPIRRAPTRPRRITTSMKREIVAYAAANPLAHQTDIGQRFGVNPGRVSEILTGKR